MFVYFEQILCLGPWADLRTISCHISIYFWVQKVHISFPSGYLRQKELLVSGQQFSVNSLSPNLLTFDLFCQLGYHVIITLRSALHYYPSRWQDQSVAPVFDAPCIPIQNIPRMCLCCSSWMVPVVLILYPSFSRSRPLL